MAQIVPRSNFAAELGTGIGSGLSKLAEKKLNDIAERHKASKMDSLFGDQETSNWVSSLKPQDQLKAIQWLQGSNPANNQQIAQQLQPVQQNIQELAGPQQALGSARPAMNQLGGMPQQYQAQPQQPLPQNLLQQQQLAQQLRQQQEQAGMQQRAMQQQNVQPQQQAAPQSNLPTLKGALAAQRGGSVAKPQDIKLSKTQEGYVKGYDTAAESVNILDRMEELWNTGKVTAGLYGNVPVGLQNAESQEYAQLGDTLAGLLVSQYGTPTNAKIKFTQGQKPQLTQSREVQKRGMERLRKEALERQGVARSRLPQGYFGEEVPAAQEAPARQERPAQSAQQEAKKEQPAQVQELKKQSPDTLNWFARKAKEEAEAEASGEKKEEGWFDWFTRNAERGKRKANETLFGKRDVEEGFKVWEDMTGKPVPEKEKEAMRNLQKKHEFFDKPQNFTEQVIDKTFETLPFIGLTGIKGAGNVAKALISDLGANTASTVAENAGAGKIAQLGASLAGGAAARKLGARLTKAASGKKILEVAANAEKEAYRDAKELGKDIKLEGRDYKRKMAKISEELMESSALDYNEKEETLRKFNQWVGDVTDGRIGADKLLQRKQDINSIYRTSPKGAKPFLSKAKELIVGQLDKVPSKEFDSAWKRGDYLHSALKYPEQFQQTIEDIPRVGKYLTNPLAYALATGGFGLFKGKGIESALGAAGTGLALGVPAAIAAKSIKDNYPKLRIMSQFLMHNDPKIKALTVDVMKNVIENNKDQLQRSLIRLSKATEPYSELI